MKVKWENMKMVAMQVKGLLLTQRDWKLSYHLKESNILKSAIGC